MENNKTLKLPVIEDIINSFIDQEIIIINFDRSTSRKISYEYNPESVEDVFTTNDNKNKTEEVI